jgi:signal transduction histidine kinase
MIADAVSAAGKGNDVADGMRSHARELEQAADLAFALGAIPRGEIESPWHLQGTPPLLAGVSGSCMIVARARNVLESIHLAEGTQWVIGRGERGEPLGEMFPGLRLEFAVRGVSSGRQWLYWAALALLASVMAFSAYLWNRDVRREARIAEIRAGFVSSISHELRTPIASIRACAEMIQMGRVQSEREVSEYIGAIVGESERLSRLVEGVLEFSRIEQGKRIYRFESLDVREVIQTAVASMDYSFQQGGFSVRLDAEPVPPVRAEREAMEQAIINLLSNAIKYSGTSRQIHVELRREGDRAVVRIRDFGLGISAEEQRHVFERFYRTRQSRESSIPGTGLGLALVEQIVKAHGGEVALDSRPGEGSAFSILLPLEMKV